MEPEGWMTSVIDSTSIKDPGLQFENVNSFFASQKMIVVVRTLKKTAIGAILMP